MARNLQVQSLTQHNQSQVSLSDIKDVRVLGVWTLDYILGVAMADKFLITDYTLNFNEINYRSCSLRVHLLPGTGLGA